MLRVCVFGFGLRLSSLGVGYGWALGRKLRA